jgi:hypothetical protein
MIAEFYHMGYVTHYESYYFLFTARGKKVYPVSLVCLVYLVKERVPFSNEKDETDDKDIF